MNDNEAGPSGVVKFWRDAGPERWFFKDEAFDAEEPAGHGYERGLGYTAVIDTATPADASAPTR